MNSHYDHNCYSQSHHQPNESYFVEDDIQSPRTTQELVKISGRKRQEFLANELSQQASDTYMKDIIIHMHQMEV